MASALIGLLGAIVGGLLVLAGDIIARRSEQRDRRIDALRAAVSDVIATYLSTRNLLIAGLFGADIHREALWPAERQVAMARLFTLPGAETLRGNVLALSEATEALIDAQIGGQPDCEPERAAQIAAVRALEKAARELKR